MDIKLHILALVGMVFILTKSKLFKKIRENIYSRNNRLGEIIQCEQCVGFWVGFFLPIPALYVGNILSILYNNFLIGCLISLLSYILGIVLNKIKK